jgi:serine protease Do
VSPNPNLRDLTVVVRGKPPAELAAAYRELAQKHQKLRPLFVAAAEGGFGSGFVIVRRERGGPRPFIVTNRHVVGLSTQASVWFEDSKAPLDASVAYVDGVYDVAVLVFSAPDAESRIASGFDLESGPAKDQQPVVASGYPGIGGSPSYQVTRGYVSNERFELTENGQRRLYVQHTAPIDPGSSGGPLTTEAGKILGVNTLKVRYRENVGLAIPSARVAEAVKSAAESSNEESEVSSATAARGACEKLLGALARGQDGIDSVEGAIGPAVVAREGFQSLDALPRDADWAARFMVEPTAVLLRATALRLVAAWQRGGSAVACQPVADAADARGLSFTVHLAGGDRVWTFAREQRRWKLVRGAVPGGRGASAFLIEAGQSKGPRKKWTPSLK